MSNPDTSISEQHPEKTAQRPTGVSPWWRVASIVLAILTAIGLAAAVSVYEQFKAQMQHMQKQMQTVQKMKYVSVLVDSAGAPAMLATLDSQEFTLQLQRLNNVVEGRDDTMQVWLVSETMRPISLGTLTAKLKTQRLNASEKDMGKATQIAVSVENKGGVDPLKGPSLPYIFQGAVIQKAQ